MPPALAGEDLDEAIRGRGLDPAEIARPFELSPEMAAWIRERIDSERGPLDRIRELLAALVGEDGLGLVYATGFTGTAREVFERREANCLSFTHLFVGMARELDLDVYYLEVERPPEIDEEGDLVVVWEHVTAGFGPRQRRLILEFTLGPQREVSSTRRLSDLTALAMHYSNRGAETLLAGDVEGATRFLEKAVTLDPGWSSAWLNLGVARRRGADLAGAEEAYRHAIAADRDNLEAYHNLALLLRLRGKKGLAGELLRLLDRRDNRDPYIFLSLGDSSFEAGRLDEARRFFRRALELAPKSAAPMAALGRLALAEERPKRARRWLARAARYDPDHRRVERLRRDLEAR